ncbi:HLA class II histocompatibility antigen, DM beta chain-like isoform X2 [Myiozetetes cayanensis]|uniref:HLA class II histocompatibility antigen, DM beta chain-like isoform X2 n=1 Tax=Myiozetetes cayanensis TaxID=478635 RepID=UPI00215E82E1|nr:HLA class II histocompatibility antigen, DM beta chain-like isoform X2 [Myiozetetes cayanensis]
MLVLLVLVLGTPHADTFVVQVASECPVVATNGSFGLTLLFNKLPLVCVDPQGPPKFVPCAGGGPLEKVGAKLADTLNGDPRWGERLQKRGGVCTQLPPKVWGDTALRRVPPKIRVVPSATGNARTPLVLTCHVWGFYPPELNLAWLRNGLLLDDPQGPPGTPPIVPMGSWTYRSEGTLEVPPPEPGDTFTCSVQHPSLQQPLLEDWAPGLAPRLSLLVALATLAMILGLFLFAFGFWRYQKKLPKPGYTPLPGDSSAGSI